ncbi:cell envelope integrity protein TolA [Pseudoduganella armeniaca]|uniref:Cell envelope integrity protein TolA n=1 Tax=Pseudoduganella armeniaca TaxID=2072590 RepID=A0A2R4C947_9BURK|nr:cell envelope integrity protein TolA [Pseudoduganella armeniaca]AVR96101.1 cell envelope integrity protein TolA [Pseudoduganella armeniaca]
MTTATETTGGSPYRVPRRESGWRAFALAIGMHALLFVFLWGGINWQNSEPVAVEAEVWDLSTQQAAPKAPPPEPEPEPEPEPVRTPPPPPTPAPPPEKVAPPKVDPEIALKKEREKKKAEKLAAEQEAKQRKLEEERKEKLEQKKLEDKKLAEKKKRDEEEKQKLAEEKEQAEKKKEDEKKKELAKKKAAAESAAKLEKQRAEEMRRILGSAAGGTGTAEKSTAPKSDSGYKAAVAAKIKSNISYAGSQDVPGNPSAEFQITQLPTGEIISVRKIKSSGIPAYDTAVENAIAKSSPLPKKKDGTVEREITAAFKLKDLP